MLEPNREIWQFFLKKKLIVKIWWLEKPKKLIFLAILKKKPNWVNLAKKTKTLRVVDNQYCAKTLADGELGWGRHGVAM